MANKCGHGRNFCMECHTPSTPPQPVVTPDPVAWRMFNGEGGYDFTDDEETSERWAKHLGEKYASWLTNLYDHPDAPEIERMKRDLVDLRESRIKELGEIRKLRAMLTQATERIKDMLQGDDGQAWKEAEKFMKSYESSDLVVQKAV